MPTKKSTAPIQKEWPALIRVIFQMEKTNRKRNQDEKKETEKERKEERKLIRGERKLSGERESD